MITLPDSATIAVIGISIWLLIFIVFVVISVVASAYKAIKQRSYTICEYCEKGEKLQDGMHLNTHGIPHALCEHLGCMRKPVSS